MAKCDYALNDRAAPPSALDTAGSAFDAATFARLMASLAPFPARPCLAAAVSGGADSMALALLAQRWARDRDGELTALIVDHGLRIGSAREAAEAATRLAGRGIRSVVLPWLGEKPRSGIQEAAREARYRLLGGWCLENGVRDLLVAHHARDLAETVWMRLARGSDGDGLAAMRAVTDTRWGRLLRPLLSVPSEALRATLRQARMHWLDDPSNDDPRFERVRWRAMAANLAANGLDHHRMGELARLAARVGDVLDEATAALLARASHIDPLGFAQLDISALAATPLPVAARALRRMIAVVGGTSRRPSLRQTRELLTSITSGAWRGQATLGRVLLIGGPNRLTLCRERRNLPQPYPIACGRTHHWDGRFTVTVEPALGQDARPLWLRPLIASDWPLIEVTGRAWDDARRTWLKRIGPTLPIVADADGPLVQPLLGFRRSDASSLTVAMVFEPRLPAISGAYFLA